MLVKDWMTPNPITVTADTSYFDAYTLLKEGNFRRLPVMSLGHLIGIVTDRNLKEATPSNATSLSADELNSVLGPLSVKDIMTKPVLTVEPEDAIESAALLMDERKISGLPVVKNGKVLGILTTTDILRAFVTILDLRDGKKLSRRAA